MPDVPAIAWSLPDTNTAAFILAMLMTYREPGGVKGHQTDPLSGGFLQLTMVSRTDLHPKGRKMLRGVPRVPESLC